jgi:hypothetical protein
MRLIMFAAITMMAMQLTAQERKFVPGQLELIQGQVDDNALHIDANTSRISQLEERLFEMNTKFLNDVAAAKRKVLAAAKKQTPKIDRDALLKTPDMPEWLVSKQAASAPVIKIAPVVVAAVAAPQPQAQSGQWVKRCSGGTCSYVWVPSGQVTQSFAVAQYGVVQRVGCAGGSCSRRVGLFGRMRR